MKVSMIIDNAGRRLPQSNFHDLSGDKLLTPLLISILAETNDILCDGIASKRIEGYIFVAELAS